MTTVQAHTPAQPEPRLVTVEGRLMMADFRRGVRRCTIEAPSGEPIPCVFDATQDELIVSALMRDVRVTGEYVRSRRKLPDLRVREITTAEGGGAAAPRHLVRQPHGRTDLDALAAAAGISGPTDLEWLMSADFWPEDESCDDFIATVQKWRDQG